jgi:hypothetical protein
VKDRFQKLPFSNANLRRYNTDNQRKKILKDLEDRLSKTEAKVGAVQVAQNQVLGFGALNPKP